MNELVCFFNELLSVHSTQKRPGQLESKVQESPGGSTVNRESGRSLSSWATVPSQRGAAAAATKGGGATPGSRDPKTRRSGTAGEQMAREGPTLVRPLPAAR